MVDAACVYTNVSTAFTDGAQFGLGAEIGISIAKMHARGPMALEELCSYKWIIKGEGQVRPNNETSWQVFISAQLLHFEFEFEFRVLILEF